MIPGKWYEIIYQDPSRKNARRLTLTGQYLETIHEVHIINLRPKGGTAGIPVDHARDVREVEPGTVSLPKRAPSRQ